MNVIRWSVAWTHKWSTDDVKFDKINIKAIHCIQQPTRLKVIDRLNDELYPHTHYQAYLKQDFGSNSPGEAVAKEKQRVEATLAELERQLDLWNRRLTLLKEYKA